MIGMNIAVMTEVYGALVAVYIYNRSVLKTQSSLSQSLEICSIKRTVAESNSLLK